MPRSWSPLELLLPTAETDGALVLGDDCPPVLAPSRPESDLSGGTVDLVILAPSRTQRRDRRWVRQAADSAASRLSQTGIAYVIPGSAIRLRRALVAEGLRSAETVLHIPDVSRTRYLVPLGTAAERWALAGGIAINRRKRLLAVGLGPRGRAAIGPTGAIHRRNPGHSLATWLFGLGGADPASGSAIVALPYAETDGAILFRFPGDRQDPDAIAKVMPGAWDELRALREIAPSAGDAGARVPQVLASKELGSMQLVLESVVSGCAAADLVAQGKIETHELQERIATWLERWNRSCARTQPLVQGDVERFVLAPAARASVEGSYLEFLRALGASALGASCPFVAGHGDLTLANILLADRGPFGVIDWEHADAETLPLVDFLYAATDVVAAGRRYADRPGAFMACFSPGGAHRLSVERLRGRMATVLGLDEVVQTLCFHACWLHHAANEADRSAYSTRGPFVTILQTIATTPELFGVPRPAQ